MRIALLGAASTGKTRLAAELGAQLRQQSKSVAVIAEVLRQWCEREGREPRPAEQLPIAREQEELVDAAADAHDVVIADTTALMVAIHGGMMFTDGELLQFALQRQRTYNLTLLTGLDLPWVADSLQRLGPQAREPVDALIRTTLAGADIAYRVVYGQGPQRTRNALTAIDATALQPAGSAASTAACHWQWNCEKCSDPQCEHRLFTGLPARGRSKIVEP
jgi:nicotinamide riboside kinase